MHKKLAYLLGEIRGEMPVIGFTKEKAMYDLGLWTYENYLLVSEALVCLQVLLLTQPDDVLMKSFLHVFEEEYKWRLKDE